MTGEMERVAAEVAARFKLKKKQINIALELLRAGESVNFIARYQISKTEGVKTAALRVLSRQLAIEARREAALARKLEYEKNKPLSAPVLDNPVLQALKEDDGFLDELRLQLWQEGLLSSSLTEAASKKNALSRKWAEFVCSSTPIQQIPTRRLQLLFEGRREQALSFHVTFPKQISHEAHLAQQFSTVPNALIEAAWKRTIQPQLETEVLARLRTRADDEVIYGIERQLQGLLLAPKVAPGKAVMGLYTDARMGLGVAVIDASGQQAASATLFPAMPDFRWHDAITVIAKCIAVHAVQVIGIGNGPHLPEIQRLLKGFASRYPDMPVETTVVDEAGMKKSLRAASGAASIARRLQNPLLELVRVPVEQMNFGELQETVNPKRLALALTGVIEDSVSRIGVDVNTAPASLLSHVPGSNTALAKAIVQFREAHGPFQTREDLKQVTGMDDVHFRQMAGFLLVNDGPEALDKTRMHPSEYTRLTHLETLSEPERRHLMALALPWRDPRAVFKQPQFNPELKTLQDLEVGMLLEGVVIRIASFGAFLDIGIYPLGLLHISALAERFVRHPYEVLQVGEVIQVQVLKIDLKKQQLSLGIKQKENKPASLEISKKTRKNKPVQPKASVAPLNTAMADALIKLKRGLS